MSEFQIVFNKFDHMAGALLHYIDISEPGGESPSTPATRP